MPELFQDPRSKPARKLQHLEQRRRDLQRQRRDAQASLDEAQAQHAQLAAGLADTEARALALGGEDTDLKADKTRLAKIGSVARSTNRQPSPTASSVRSPPSTQKQKP